MSTLADEFNAQREVALAGQRATLAAADRDRDARSAVMFERREHLLSLMRPAQKWEYEAWLTGFLKQGGAVTHWYDYAYPSKKFWVALSDFEIVPLYGSASVSIIVPKGIRLLGGDTGHCGVYITAAHDDGDIFLYKGFHDSAPHTRPSVVPAYVDTEVLA